jgi:hypothetical protein
MKPVQGDTQHTQQQQEQQQEQQLEVDHITPRRSAATMSFRRAVATIAVLFSSLCIVGVAASQQGQSVCSEQWNTAVLSVARYYPLATSLPNQGLAIFAGGEGAGL